MNPEYENLFEYKSASTVFCDCTEIQAKAELRNSKYIPSYIEASASSPYDKILIKAGFIGTILQKINPHPG